MPLEHMQARRDDVSATSVESLLQLTAGSCSQQFQRRNVQVLLAPLILGRKGVHPPRGIRPMPPQGPQNE